MYDGSCRSQRARRDCVKLGACSQAAETTARAGGVALPSPTFLQARTEAVVDDADHYTVLGLRPGASRAEVRRAYRRLVKRLHPDLTSALPPPLPSVSLHQVYEAWYVLGDDQRRATYDATKRGEHVELEIPVPRGFRLFPRQRYASMSNEWRYRVADSTHLALSLAALEPDLSGLADVGAGDVWKLDAVGIAVTDDQLVHVARLHRLLVLDLSDTMITDDGLCHLTDLPLFELSVAGCVVTDRGMETIASLPGLVTLSLFGTKVGDRGVQLLAGHPALRVLDVRETMVGAGALETLATIPELRVLRVSKVSRRDRRAFNERRRDLDEATRLISRDPGALLCHDAGCRCVAARRQREAVVSAARG